MWWLPKALEPLNTDLSNFDWAGQDFNPIIKQEIFDDRIYELFYEIKQNDVVLDIGANVGAFTYSILDRKPKKVYCFEPSKPMIDTLWKNTRSPDVVYINYALAADNSEETEQHENTHVYYHEGKFKTITFDYFLQKHEVNHIDFMKIDCEGGEYSIFTEKNKDFILNNISHIAGEWHIHPIYLEEFKKFRDLYLKDHKSFHVTAKNYPDVSQWIFSDSYLEWYLDAMGTGAQFMIYMNNTVK